MAQLFNRCTTDTADEIEPQFYLTDLGNFILDLHNHHLEFNALEATRLLKQLELAINDFNEKLRDA